MVSDYYPDIHPDWLLPIRMVFEGLRDDPLWLERAACPYDEDTVAALRGLWEAVRVPPPARPAPAREPLGADKWDQLAREADILFQDLRDLQDTLDQTDVREKLAFYRTATGLLDKLISLGERAINIKHVSDFQARVVQVFDEVLTPEQRTRALTALGREAGA